MKTYAGVKRRAEPSQIEIEDLMLARQRKQNKLSTLCDPSPFRAVCKKGTMITAQCNGKYITWNASDFKVLHLQAQNITEEGEEHKRTLKIK